MAKRKASTVAAAVNDSLPPLLPPNHKVPVSLSAGANDDPRPAKKTRTAPPPAPRTNGTTKTTAKRGRGNESTNPDENPEILDGQSALRASPDADLNEKLAPATLKSDGDSESSLSDAPASIDPPGKRKAASAASAATKSKKGSKSQNGILDPEVTKSKAATKPKKGSNIDENVNTRDPEAEGEDEEADEEEIKEALSRPPPVNSDYLPLPWKGRLGYACLCTYLRYSNPPVFCSRTTRIASILEHRHPLKDPSLPEHAIKNRPDKDQPADIRRGQLFVENIALANVRDVAKMIRWNDKYNIKFLRLSSEMFPFASHEEYGYKLAPFAAEALAEAGKVIAELGHRVTTHPGQFTQLGSPRKQVIDSAVRDLEYHDEMLSLLKLPAQQDRDAVMILHMGGTFGDKAATLDRFRENYAKLSQSIKNRLVLENDDMCWSVHDLLPVCKELNIPLVLDYHHHNIIFDADKIREGTKDIMELYDEIAETWTRKGIKQKMHYSEPTPAAITGTQRRKHNPRVATLPPCTPDMDLMIEAKDKEQAVFELMRTFKLPGFDTFNDIIPHVRKDDNKEFNKPKRKVTPKKKRSKKGEDVEASAAEAEAEAEDEPQEIGAEDVGMGGPLNRVYWPPGMEHWLRPVKRVVKKKEPGNETEKMTPAKKKKAAAAAADAAKALENGIKQEADNASVASAGSIGMASAAKTKKGQTNAGKSGPTKSRQKAKKSVPAPSVSDEDEDMDDGPVTDGTDEEPVTQAPAKRARPANSRKSSRAAAGKVSYVDEEEDSSE